MGNHDDIINSTRPGDLGVTVAQRDNGGTLFTDHFPGTTIPADHPDHVSASRGATSRRETENIGAPVEYTEEQLHVIDDLVGRGFTRDQAIGYMRRAIANQVSLVASDDNAGNNNGPRW